MLISSQGIKYKKFAWFGKVELYVVPNGLRNKNEQNNIITKNSASYHKYTWTIIKPGIKQLKFQHSVL